MNILTYYLYTIHNSIFKGGYKGYGLSMMVEVLTSVLSGATIGPFVRSWQQYETPANLVSNIAAKAV